MKRKMGSLLMACIVLLSIVPAVFAEGTGLLTLTVEYYIENTETKIAPTYKASLPEGSSYGVESPTVVGSKVAEGSAQTVSGKLYHQLHWPGY